MNATQLARAISGAMVVFGAVALITPQTIAQLFGLNPTANGFGEIGAVYGGAFVAMGAIAFYATRIREDMGQALLTALAVIFFGFALGRAAVTFTAPLSPGLISWLGFVLEAASGGLLLNCAWRLGSDT
jgi:hypothetical protein